MVTFSAPLLDAWLASWFLPFVRILALFSAAPVLSHRSLPRRARVVAAAVMAMLVAPTIGATAAANFSLASAEGVSAVVQQVAIGLALGFAARLVFAVFELAGEIIGLQMGLNFAGFFNPQGGTQSAVGSWLATLATLLFLSVNAHLMVLETLMATFRSIPIGSDAFAALGRLELHRAGADVFRLAVSLALPAILLMLFINLVLGLASRVAPQLSIFSIGFPLTIVAGLCLLAVGAPHTLSALLQSIEVFIGPWR